MSIATRNPARVVGGQVFSGGPNTGEVQQVRGGTLTATVWSGGATGMLFSGGGTQPIALNSGDHAVFWSGAGRLNSVTVLGYPFWTLSGGGAGIGVTFYDSNVAAVSGPNTTAASGLTNLWQSQFACGQSGQITPPLLNQSQPVVNVDMPFSKGLAVNAPSGVLGFSFSWTPEVVPVY